VCLSGSPPSLSPPGRRAPRARAGGHWTWNLGAVSSPRISKGPGPAGSCINRDSDWTASDSEPGGRGREPRPASGRAHCHWQPGRGLGLSGRRRAAAGRGGRNRSARASKDHHCIFGLQTYESSHSPGPPGPGRCVTDWSSPRKFVALSVRGPGPSGWSAGPHTSSGRGSCGGSSRMQTWAQLRCSGVTNT